MRDLTKKEARLFDIFILGYREGLKGVPGAVLADKNIISPVPQDEDIKQAYKDKVFIFRRSKARSAEFRQGYYDGYFRMLSSEQPRVMLDPKANADIYEYLKNTWLYDHEYPSGR